MQQTYFSKQLVLIGGGHANVQVLRKLCMNEYKGLHVILINDSYSSIYSGMTPGYIQGSYSLSDISIDLQRLCFNAGATFINDQVYKLDKKNKTIYLKSHPTLFYDILSINTGSVSNIQSIKINNGTNYISVKPISNLVKNLNKIDSVIKKSSQKKINIVGGGIAAFEISFALHNRYEGNISVNIVSNTLLAEKNLNKSSYKTLLKIAKIKKIKIISANVLSASKSMLKLSNNHSLDGDITLFASGASLPEWLKKSNLKLIDEFIGVNHFLQTLSEKNIFVTGDAANIQGFRRSKSGVMAVRQGEILSENILLYLENRSLKNFKPQNNWLYLIGTFKNSALFNYYGLCFEGKLLWNLKKYIDQNFIKKFSFLDKTLMNKKKYLIKDSKDEKEMFCQGCGSKVSKKSLVNYLKKNNINKELTDSTLININQKYILQTIDHIKLFQSFDPYDFGIISYLHSQNDILASGGSVKSLSISVGVPFSEEKIEKFYLESFMEGIKSEALKDKSIIAAGHSYQTGEPSITITMNGKVNYKSIKSLAKENDLIYLSKPLGTGYLLSAYFKNSSLINFQDFKLLTKYLKKSNKNAAEIALKFKCKTMTDISGFGLASHLGDICESSNLSAEIILNDKLLINKKLKLLNTYKSTGFENNYIAASEKLKMKKNHSLINILFDPQTNGPLLMVINEKDKDFFEKDFYKSYKVAPILLGKFTKKKEELIIFN